MIECTVILQGHVIVENGVRSAKAEKDIRLQVMPRKGEMVGIPYGDEPKYLWPIVQQVKHLPDHCILDCTVTFAVPNEADFDKGLARWREAGFTVEEHTHEN